MPSVTSFRPLRLSLVLVCGLLSAGVVLAAPAPVKPVPKVDPAQLAAVRQKFLDGPLAGVREIVFAVRTAGSDPHWYANIGYWSEDANKPMYVPDGGQLCRLDLRSGKVAVLIDEPKGCIRDPAVHYDGRKILFSWLKGGTKNYNLYEVNCDGSGLRQITSGPWDDFESCYLPNGDIVFCSTRCKRWVSCWFTHVATMHRCDGDGRSIRVISSNIEQDNTPAVLPDGRILYTRWEYVDRSQVDFHHLWTVNPDGTDQMAFFGNMSPGVVMIDAKPIAGTSRIISVFSPGHGINEHRGPLTIVDPAGGPDDKALAQTIAKGNDLHDPYPISPDCFLAATNNKIIAVDSQGQRAELYTGAKMLHEPRPLLPRPREVVIPDRESVEIHRPAHSGGYPPGRNLDGIRPGEIKKLLVLEVLPKPVNFSGGPIPITDLGSFNLERVLGAVPVESDGSAYMELPAHRPVFFVAMDENNNSIKRMQSFVSVMPGETTGCVGCHEHATQTISIGHNLLALKRAPSRIQAFEGQPDVFDFPRDIQPILDRHCVKCHNYEKPTPERLVLTGDRGPIFSHGYYGLIYSGQVADGRNGVGNSAPRTIGATASPLMKKLTGGHYDIKASPREIETVRLWIESGAPYAGTYASLGCGMTGIGLEGGNMKDAFLRRCGACHDLKSHEDNLEPGRLRIPAAHMRNPGSRVPYERYVVPNDPRFHRGSDVLVNLTRPAKSRLLLAPLAKEAGGWGVCTGTVFAATADPDYKTMLAGIAEIKRHLDTIKRFDMPGFRPNDGYVREMKRFGILPADFDVAKAPIDVYQTDQAYWRSLWWQPMLASDSH